MGWSGYGCRVKVDDFLDENVLEWASKSEAADLIGKTEGAAALLGDSIHVGCRPVARALAKGTGTEPYNLEWWPDQVKEIARNANWDFEAEPGEEGSKEAARIFLQICADNGLGIRFD